MKKLRKKGRIFNVNVEEVNELDVVNSFYRYKNVYAILYMISYFSKQVVLPYM